MKKCSFCGRQEKDVDFLIPSPDKSASICNFCIDLCQQVLEEYDLDYKENSEENSFNLSSLSTPKQIKEKLDEYENELKIYVPKESLEAYQNHFYWKKYSFV